MSKADQKKTDIFFYDNYSRVWEGADLEDMPPIYAAEMRDLLRCLEQGMPYHQEFAKDYRLAQQLRMEVNGNIQSVQKPKNEYHIVPAQGVVLFQKESEICYQCSYRKFFQILSFYIQQLQERFLMQEAIQWQTQLEKLKKGRFHAQLEKLTDKLRFWDHSAGNPDAHFEGAKKLDLYPKYSIFSTIALSGYLTLFNSQWIIQSKRYRSFGRIYTIENIVFTVNENRRYSILKYIGQFR